MADPKLIDLILGGAGSRELDDDERQDAELSARAKLGLAPKSGVVGTILDKGAQGLMMGFADEVGAGLRSVVHGTKYDDELARKRRMLRDEEIERPGLSMASEIGGSALPIIASAFTPGGQAAGAGQATSLGARIGAGAMSGAKAGTIAGGVTGFGEGEGGFENRLESGLKGAAVGGAVGLGVGAGAAGVGGVLANRGRSARDIAARDILDSLRQQGRSVDDLAGAVDDVGERGGTLVDALGTLNPRGTPGADTPLGRRVDKALKSPVVDASAVESRLAERMDAAPGRISRDIAETMGEQRPLYESLDDLAAARGTQAKPHYDAARDTWAPAADQPELNDVFERLNNNVLGKIKEVARENKVEPEDIVKAVDGVRRVSRSITYTDIDSAHKALVRIINAETDKVTGKVSADGRNYINQKKDLQAALSKTEAGRKYLEGVRQFAGIEAVQDATDLGRKILTTDPRAVGRRLQTLGPSEVEGYMIGAQDALLQKLAKVPPGRDASQAVKLSANVREQLGTALRSAFAQTTNDPEQIRRMVEAQLDTLQQRLNREANMAGTQRRYFNNSRTSQLDEAGETLNAGRAVADTAADLVGGAGFMPTVGRGIRAVPKAISGFLDRNSARGARRQELVDMSMQTDAAINRNVVEELRRVQDSVGRYSPSRRAGAAGGIAGADRGRAAAEAAWLGRERKRREDEDVDAFGITGQGF